MTQSPIVPSSHHPRGVALPLVLAVLVCLLAVAIPFSLSMRHESHGSTFRIHRDDVRREDLMLQQESAAHLARTAPDRDPTPYFDDIGELQVPIEQVAQDAGLKLSPRDRLWSVQVEDHGARIDLNAAPLQVIARGLHLSSRTTRRIGPEDKEIRVEDGECFQDSGYVWIDGEISYYGRREKNVLNDLVRPSVVPGFFEPVEIGDPRTFDANVEVIDFRAYLVATETFRAREGAEFRYDTVLQAASIARYGLGALGEESLALLERRFTVFHPDQCRDRWVDPQRIFSSIVGGETRAFFVDSGQYYGAGTIVRIFNDRGGVHYGVVVRSQPQGNVFQIALDLEIDISAEGGLAMVESMQRRPINVNTCSLEMLELLWTGLAYGNEIVSASDARRLAKDLIKLRPLQGPKALDAWLEQLIEKKTEIDPELARMLYAHGHHAGDFFLGYATLPFSYDSSGTFEVHTGASTNYEVSARERGRSFVDQVMTLAGGGRSLRILKSQRDFDDPFRLTRRAHGYATHPENLHITSSLERLTDPPGRAQGEALYDLDRFPSEQLEGAGVRLAPGRMEGFTLGPGVSDVTIHFDEGETISTEVDGWNLEEQGPPPPLSVNGNAVSTELGQATEHAQHGRTRETSVASDVTSILRVQPFAVSMWWNPGSSLSEQVLFDTAVQPVKDRVLLEFDGSRLVFRVFDSSTVASTTSVEDPIGTIRYEFDDGLPLEQNTWYHVTAFCRGNRAGQMALCVDGRPRGKSLFFTRLTQDLDEGVPSYKSGGIADRAIVVKDASSLPNRGVVCVGGVEIVEYTSKTGNSLQLQPDPNDPFGGRAARGSNLDFGGNPLAGSELAHPAQSSVEMYGYSALLSSDILPTGGGQLIQPLGRFQVAMVDPQFQPDEIRIQGLGTVPLGRGFESQNLQQLPLVGVNQNEDSLEEDTFQENGGYALILQGIRIGSPNRDAQNPNGEPGSDQPTTVGKTTMGSWVGGIEVIRYDRYDFRAKVLSNVQRAATLGSRLPPNFGKNVWSGEPIGEPHAFVVKKDARVVWVPPPAYEPAFYPVLVIPISIEVTGAGALKEGFLVPEARGGQGITRCELVQIGLDFEDPEQNSTEWVRYNSIIEDLFVRDQPDAAQRTGQTLMATYGFLLEEVERQGKSWTQDQLDDFYEFVNQEPLPDRSTVFPMLAFRGVLGTRNCKHARTDAVLPVWRARRQGVDRTFVRPGRHDEVTLIEGGSTSAVFPLHEINYGWSQDGAEDWGRDSHVALRRAAESELKRTPFAGGDPDDALSTGANYVDRTDPRRFSRVVKFPSGELPSEVPAQIHLGRAFDGAGTARGYLDEVRVMRAGDPNENFPLALNVLAEDLDENEEEALRLDHESLRFPHMQRRDDTTEAFQILERIPADGCILKIGDEYIVCNRKNGQQMEIAENGRKVQLGVDPGFHGRDETAMVLPFLVISRLEGELDDSGFHVQVADTRGFPESGFVLIDQELIAYTHVEDGNRLFVPTFLMRDPERAATRPSAAFRGRYGTFATSHSRDSVVMWWPHRYPDWYAERADIPELAAYEVSFPVRRGFFTSLSWEERSDDGQDPMSELIVQARVQGRGDFTAEPGQDPFFFEIEDPTESGEPWRIDRQGDLLRVRVLTRYRQGAFDAQNFTRNSWKRAPFLELLGVEYLAEPVIERFAERR